jgi:serine protease Do
MTSLVQNGHVERGFLGVNIQELTPQLAKQFNLNTTQGALVSDVTPNSPAEKAGLKSGDVIIEFNGKALTDSRHLRLQVAETIPGSSVPLKVIRDGASKTLSITLKSMPADQVAEGPSTKGDTAGDALHGVAVTDLDSGSRTQLKVPAQIVGALVSQVAPDSPAYEAGLRPGDLITEINRKPIKNAEQAVAATAKPAGNQTLLQIWSHGNNRYVVVDETQEG